VLYAASSGDGAMRVAFVTNFAPHYRRPLFDELAKRWDVDFIFFSDDREWYRSREMRHQIGNFQTVELARRSAHGSVYLSDLPRTVARGRYDVMVKCLSGKLMTPLAYWSARRWSLPIVLWSGMWDHPATVTHRATRPLVRALHRQADAIVAYGSHVKWYLVRESGVDARKIFVSGQAVDATRFAPGGVDRVPSQTILYVGQFEDRKGLRTLVAAFRSLCHRGAHLRFVGSGSLAGWLLEQSQADVRIEVGGYCSQEELADEYRRALCVVLPSERTVAGREPWGLVVNEAMHSGRAVVVTHSVGAAAAGLVVDGRNGFVVPERDPGGLGGALRQLLECPRLALTFGAQGQRDVERFTYCRMADAFDAACAFALHSRAKSVRV
jgi:glycosyltransferase involved in cell wall biosynthesis